MSQHPKDQLDVKGTRIHLPRDLHSQNFDAESHNNVETVICYFAPIDTLLFGYFLKIVFDLGSRHLI